VITVGKGTIHPWHLPGVSGPVDAPKRRSAHASRAGERWTKWRWITSYTLQIANNTEKRPCWGLVFGLFIIVWPAGRREKETACRGAKWHELTGGTELSKPVERRISPEQELAAARDRANLLEES
jgi:hypothetical protein